MHITPDMLEKAYEYLRSTPPFRRWGLPRGDEVEFHVMNKRQVRGDCRAAKDRHIIRLSAHNIGRTESLMAVLAHEMVHVHCDLRGVKAAHGREFLKFAAQVCREHGFDEKLF